MTQVLERSGPVQVRGTPGQRVVRLVVAVVALGWMCLVSPAASQTMPEAGVAAAGTMDGGVVLAMASGLDSRIHRVVNHVERSLGRLGVSLTRAASVWLTMIVSALGCLLIIALASVVDWRMLDIRRNGLGGCVRDLVLGAWTFVRMLRDRRTPIAARVLVIGAVVYWLLPVDFLTDAVPVYGFVDDVIGAVIAGKGFVALCPDAVIAANAPVGRH